MNFVVVETEQPKRRADTGPAKAQLPILVAQQEPVDRPHVAEPAKPQDNRRAHRKSVRLAAQVADGSQQGFACTVRDMSAMGAMLELHPQEGRRYNGEIQIPERFFLVVENLLERSVVEVYVMWRQGNRAGVQFIGPINSTQKRLPVRKAPAKEKSAASNGRAAR